MSETWFISDSHFGHRNIINFKRVDGSPLRPFSTCEEMDETMVERWNAVVRPADRVYHLGDVAISRKSLAIVCRLNGRKCLIKGNHDIFKAKDYFEHFDDIRAYKVFPKYGVICSHIPVHVGQLQGRWIANAHGHLHANVLEDRRYVNLCVEHTDYRPINFDQVLKRCGLEPIRE